MKYRLLEHTADLKVEIYGKDPSELFANAAFMLFDCMVDLHRVKETEARDIQLNSTDLSELFLDWLRELLFLFSTQGLVTKRVIIKHINPEAASLDATIYGQTYEPSVHGLKIEIKTPTYHQYSITEIKAEGEKKQPNLKATVVFDV